MNRFSRLFKTALFIGSFLSIACCSSAKFIPLPPRVVSGIYHPVGKGETLWRICKTYNADLQEVAELNSIKDASQIKVGDKLFIPGAKKIRRVQVYRKEPPKKKVVIKQSKGRFAWPVKGRVVAYFGIKKGGTKYDGIDIRAPLGTLIKAADGGKVVFSNKMSGYGNIIILKHKDNYTTVYAHNLTNLVKEGSWVRKGTPIASLGHSHNPSASPSLHFQIRRYNKARNPLFYLN